MFVLVETSWWLLHVLIVFHHCSEQQTRLPVTSRAACSNPARFTELMFFLEKRSYGNRGCVEIRVCNLYLIELHKTLDRLFSRNPADNSMYSKPITISFQRLMMLPMYPNWIRQVKALVSTLIYFHLNALNGRSKSSGVVLANQTWIRSLPKYTEKNIFWFI